MSHKRGKLLILSSIAAALASSLCCILPFAAFILGALGVAPTASWLAPLRPYLALSSILTLGLAWYRKLRHTKQHCTAHHSSSFWESKAFLGIMTALSLTMLSFPYYAHYFYPSATSQDVLIEEVNTKETVLKVQGMHCAGCEKTIQQAIQQLPGIISINASYKTRTMRVRFDKSKTTAQEIQQVVQAVGYSCSAG